MNSALHLDTYKKTKPFGLGLFRNNVLFVCYSIFSKPIIILINYRTYVNIILR